MRRFASRQLYSVVLLPCAMAARHASTQTDGSTTTTSSAAGVEAKEQKQASHKGTHPQQKVSASDSTWNNQTANKITLAVILVATALYLIVEWQDAPGTDAKSIAESQVQKWENEKMTKAIKKEAKDIASKQ